MALLWIPCNSAYMDVVCVCFTLDINIVHLLFHLDNRLLDTTLELKALNLKLSVENEQLRSGSVAPSNGNSAATTAKISQLESKLLTQQEQLTDLHKRKGENAQMIIDLNLKLEKQNKLLAERETRYGCNIFTFFEDLFSLYFFEDLF